MFHKRSTNVPTSNRNEPKTSEFVPESSPSKEIISIWSGRADSGLNQNNLLSTRQIRERYQTVLVSFPKRYRNVCPFVFDITTCLSVHRLIDSSAECLFSCLSVQLFFCSAACLFSCLSAQPPVCSAACLLSCLSVQLAAFLFSC
jgi:hypothetical protein